MSKSLSLMFAVISVLFMLATAFAIDTSGWLAFLFGILTMVSIASGFVVKARLSKKRSAT
jgi:hypothetical protein